MLLILPITCFYLFKFFFEDIHFCWAFYSYITNVFYIVLVYVDLLEEKPLLILDASWYQKNEETDVFVTNDIPYFGIDQLFNPFVEVLERYLRMRNAEDVLIVLEKSQCKQFIYFPFSIVHIFINSLFILQTTQNKNEVHNKNIFGKMQNYVDYTFSNSNLVMIRSMIIEYFSKTLVKLYRNTNQTWSTKQFCLTWLWWIKNLSIL